MERTFVSLAPDASLEDLATAMHESDVTHVPIVDAGVVVGDRDPWRHRPSPRRDHVIGVP